MLRLWVIISEVVGGRRIVWREKVIITVSYLLCRRIPYFPTNRPHQIRWSFEGATSQNDWFLSGLQFLCYVRNCFEMLN